MNNDTSAVENYLAIINAHTIKTDDVQEYGRWCDARDAFDAHLIGGLVAVMADYDVPAHRISTVAAAARAHALRSCTPTPARRA